MEVIRAATSNAQVPAKRAESRSSRSMAAFLCLLEAELGKSGRGEMES